MDWSEEDLAVFKYLFILEGRGLTNMFNVAAFIILKPEFAHISLNDAILMVRKWLINYDEIKGLLSGPSQ
jgi:hypothetical protein